MVRARHGAYPHCSDVFTARSLPERARQMEGAGGTPRPRTV